MSIWVHVGEIESSTKQLHPEQGKDDDEQEQQKQERDNGPHRVHERSDQVP